MDRSRSSVGVEAGDFAAMLRIAFLLIVPIWLVGCAEREISSNESEAKAPPEPRASLTLRVLVVNEPELAEAINRLRGEWAERGIGEFIATAATWADVAAAKSIDADLLVFPSRYLGDLSGRRLLRPVRANVLESDAFAADDLFPLVRQEIIKWGGQVMALPLGIQLVTSADGVDSQPALSLLARAAPKAVTRERLGVLFDSETMKPRITEAAFVEALAEMAASQTQPIAEPSAKEPPTVPVLGYADRMAAVTSSSRNAASAFKLLGWLAQADISGQFARAGNGAFPVRRSAASSTKWYDENTTAEERRELAETFEQVLSGDRVLIIPRIPGVDEYLAPLNEAVNASIGGGVEPKAALEKAAQRWEEITDARGRDVQREAYLNHLNIDERR